jgi:hypothetical protein
VLFRSKGVDLNDGGAETAAKIERYLNDIGLMGEAQKLALATLTKGSEISQFRKKMSAMKFDDAYIKNLINNNITAANTAINSQFKNAAD